MVKKLAVAALASVLVAACTGIAPGASPSPVSSLTPEPSETATAGQSAAPTILEPSNAPASPEPTLEPTVAPSEIAACPAKDSITLGQLLEAELTCFGSENLVIRAWLDRPPPVGWMPPAVEPGWLYYPPSGETLIALWSIVPAVINDGDNRLCPDVPGCSWAFLHLAPTSPIVLGTEARWVIATGHRNDPAAADCHYVYPDDWPDPRSDDADARLGCRYQFLVVDLANAPD